MSINVESGLRQVRVEFLREVTYGIAPADPAWLRFSDEVFQATWEGSADIFEKRRLGSVDPDAFFAGPETHQLTIEYYLQQWIKSGGNPLDALGDAIDRDADNNLPNSIHVQIREKREVSGGADSGGIRVYTIAQGAYAGEVTIPGQIDTGEPIRPLVVYQAEKIRSYEVSQPAASTLIGCNGTDALDITQSVTVESDGTPATVDQTVALSGVAEVSLGVSLYPEIDSISLDLETIGDVEIWINDGTDASPTKGTIICTLRGSANYDNTEGDLGIPPLGAGSHQAALATAYEQFIDDSIERPAATSLATYINSAEFRINNNLEVFPQLGSRKQIIVPGIRNVELSATVFGPSESHRQIEDHLMVSETDIIWTLTGGTIQLDDAVLRDPPSRQYTAEEVTMNLDLVFVGQGLTISG